IAQEAEVTRASLYAVEQKHLGTNHAMLGKQLAQKWRLPEAIAMAIWLHHSDAVTRLDDLAEAQVARLVWAADHIVRDAGIGESGSFSEPESLGVIAKTLDVDTATLEQIRDDLSQALPEKAEVLGLDMPNALARYCDMIHSVATSLSTKHTELSEENRALKTAATYLGFAREFLLHTGPSAGAINVAADLARRWQRFFQTGSVCLYLEDAAAGGTVDAVIVEALGHSHKMVLQPPDEMSAIPRAVSERFAMLDAQSHLGWLAEQVDGDFDLGRTKLVPLLADGGAIAVLAFELNLPGDAALFAEKYEMAASMAGTVLGLAVAKERQMHFSERLIQAMGQAAAVAAAPAPAPAAEEAKPVKSPLAVLAEMAAGVAHELNNPLSVISGRAQLLVEDEENEARQKDLNRIQENARAVAEVIDDLMSFAEPSTPRPASTSVRQIIDEAVQLAGQKSGVDHVNAQVQASGGSPDVFVDSGQVVSALANVISNAIESYSDSMGPVKIVIEPGPATVRLKISDLGCGMDAETLEKATHPFFSAKPAGRQRGMGLAYATRLIQINGGTLAIESQPDQGTTVTVTLPYE
ncbi:MAG: ATP-binding protein, partial [Planctomycetota bacterium]